VKIKAVIRDMIKLERTPSDDQNDKLEIWSLDGTLRWRFTKGDPPELTLGSIEAIRRYAGKLLFRSDDGRVATLTHISIALGAEGDTDEPPPSWRHS
jgi:hypothetical protein